MPPEEKHQQIEIHPKEIRGSWDAGYVLDLHTISSTRIGYNEFDHPEFDTQRSPLGELVYRLKCRGDKNAIPAINQNFPRARLENRRGTSGAEAQVIIRPKAARLKPCPSTNRSGQLPAVQPRFPLSSVVSAPAP